ELGARIGEAVCLARDLVNEPGGSMTPQAFAKVAAEVAEREDLGISILDEDDIASAGLGGLPGVNRGSDQPPRFVELTYAPELRTGCRDRRSRLPGPRPGQRARRLHDAPGLRQGGRRGRRARGPRHLDPRRGRHRQRRTGRPAGSEPRFGPAAALRGADLRARASNWVPGSAKPSAGPATWSTSPAAP